MPSTFLGLYIASSGLNAANVAINVTANNISNTNTKGYSRQVAEQQASIPQRVYTSYGMIGTGVTVTNIAQIRDSYYDQKYWKNQSNLGENTQKHYYMNQIEDLYFCEMTSSGFTTYYNKFTAALSQLETAPAESSYRNAAVQSAQTLASYFNDVATSLTKYQDDANQQISVVVDQINTTAQGIASLNKQIQTLELNGTTANELRDQRANLVDELSKYVGVTVTDEESATGSSVYTISINNQILVQGFASNTLEVVARDADQSRQEDDNVGLYDLKWSTGQNFAMYNAQLTGELKGLIDIRDGNNNQVIDYPATGQLGVDYKGIPYYREQTDYFVKEYTRQFNMLQMEGEDNNGNSTAQMPFFIPTTMTTAQVADQAKSIYALYSGTDADGVADILNADGSTTSWTKADAEKWVKEKALIYAKEQHPSLSTSSLVGAGGSVKEEYLNEYLYGNAAGGTEPGYMILADYVTDQMTAEYVGVNKEIIAENDLMATTRDTANGVGGQDIISEMVALADKRFLITGTAESFMEGLVSVSSIDTKAAKSLMANYENISATIVNQRSSVSGVDEDEEAANLVKFKNAYDLAAKCISIMSELYDKLINETAV